jgi:iron complex transport system ATP-binding protein
MALAQDTAIMLLDEPTTFLDPAHQVEVLDLLAELNTSEGRTVVCVLHDLNQTCRYAHHLVAMANGGVVAEGPPAEVVTEELVADVFGLGTRVVADPVAGTPLVIPLGRHGSVAADKGSAPHNLEQSASVERDPRAARAASAERGIRLVGTTTPRPTSTSGGAPSAMR